MLAKGKLALVDSNSLGCKETVLEVRANGLAPGTWHLALALAPGRLISPLVLCASWIDCEAAGGSVGNIVLGESMIEVLGSIGVESLDSITVAVSFLGLRPLDLGLTPALGLLFRTWGLLLADLGLLL